MPHGPRYQLPGDTLACPASALSLSLSVSLSVSPSSSNLSYNSGSKGLLGACLCQALVIIYMAAQMQAFFRPGNPRGRGKRVKSLIATPQNEHLCVVGKQYVWDLIDMILDQMRF